ncbi:hypothetical protein [Pantanalinema sp. GBBB05]|uniref:hypothetical protein n=1 Tax=Pantanalinema sp. GBBB05 TaxID=2604139 RepID=UPI001D29BCD5|nr:hypothetical protein [Pantanalinema sp. GBBB05]
MAKGRKEKFNSWLESIFSSLENEYNNCNLWLDSKQLKERHWYKLWRIFEECIELEDVNSDWSVDSFEAEKVILETHGKSYSELDWHNQMLHYMNSRNYP